MEKDLLEGLTEEEIEVLAREGRALYQKRQRERQKKLRELYQRHYYARLALEARKKGEQDDQ